MTERKSTGGKDPRNDESTAYEYTHPSANKGPQLRALDEGDVQAVYDALVDRVDGEAVVHTPSDRIAATVGCSTAAAGRCVRALADDPDCPLAVERWSGESTTPAVWRVEVADAGEREVVADGGVPDETHLDDDGLWIPPTFQTEKQLVIRTPRSTIQHWGEFDSGYYGMVTERDFGNVDDIRNPQNGELAPDKVSLKIAGEDAHVLEVVQEPEVVADGGETEHSARFICHPNTRTLHKGTRESGAVCGQPSADWGTVDAANPMEAVLTYGTSPCRKCFKTGYHDLRRVYLIEHTSVADDCTTAEVVESSRWSVDLEEYSNDGDEVVADGGDFYRGAGDGQCLAIKDSDSERCTNGVHDSDHFCGTHKRADDVTSVIEAAAEGTKWVRCRECGWQKAEWDGPDPPSCAYCSVRISRPDYEIRESGDNKAMTDGGIQLDAYYVLDAHRNVVVAGPTDEETALTEAAERGTEDHLVVSGAALQQRADATTLAWETGEVRRVTDGGTREHVTHIEGFGDDGGFYRCDECGATGETVDEVDHHEDCPGEEADDADDSNAHASRVAAQLRMAEDENGGDDTDA